MSSMFNHSVTNRFFRTVVKIKAVAVLVPALLMASTAAQAYDLARLSIWGSSTAERLGIPLQRISSQLRLSFFNGGNSGAFADSILARQGARPAGFAFSQAELDRLNNSDRTAVRIPGIRLNSQVKSWTGVLQGTDITGTVSYSDADASWYFTRTGGTGTIAAENPYSFIPDRGVEYADGFQVLNIGKNDFILGSSVEQIVAATRAAYDSLESSEKRVIVLGHFIQSDVPDGSPLKERILAVNRALKDLYGDNFIDLQAYVTGSQIWRDLGIIPTVEDLDFQARGLKPPSFSDDSLHLNAAASAAVVRNLILPRFIALVSPELTAQHVIPVVTTLLPALSGATGAMHDSVNRTAQGNRSMLHHDWQQGVSPGLRVTGSYGLSDSSKSDAESNQLGVGLIYGYDTLRFSADYATSSQNLNESERERQDMSFGIAQSFGDWHLAAQAGIGSGDLSGDGFSGNLTSYKAEFDSRFVEMQIARSLAQGNWTFLPSAWLRRQQIDIDGTRYTLVNGNEGSLKSHKSTASIAGIGVNMFYRGWRDTITPSLSVSYENTLSSRDDDYEFADLLLQGNRLGSGSTVSDNERWLINPSLSFNPTPTGQALVSAWYDSGSEERGVDIRWLQEF